LDSKRAGLNKKKKKGQKQQREGKSLENEANRETKGLPGRDRHLLVLVALRAYLLSPNNFRPGAFGGRSLARTGVSSRRLVLFALGHELIQELIPDLGLQGRHVLVDLWFGAS
jgi:hypothetical protein